MLRILRAALAAAAASAIAISACHDQSSPPPDSGGTPPAQEAELPQSGPASGTGGETPSGASVETLPPVVVQQVEPPKQPPKPKRTDPRGSRPHFGALLLGVWEGERLRYAGHTGTGFSDAELGRLARLLAPLTTPTCPFDPCPRTNERPHWVRPELVVEVAFTEWTTDGKLRHPVYLGLRDDKDPLDVTRDP